MFPNTGLTQGEVEEKALLVCGEDEPEVIAAMEAAGAVLFPVAKLRAFSTYAFSLSPEGDERFTLCLAGPGSACVEIAMTELYHCGARKFVLSGTCGSLSPEIKTGSVALISKALRRDGASFHYIPDGDEISLSSELRAEVESILKEAGTTFLSEPTVSTDSFYCMGAERGPDGALRYPGIPLKEKYSPPEKFLELKKIIEAGGELLIEMESAAFYSICEASACITRYAAIKGVSNQVPFIENEQVENSGACLKRAIAASLAVLSAF